MIRLMYYVYVLVLLIIFKVLNGLAPQNNSDLLPDYSSVRPIVPDKIQIWWRCFQLLWSSDQEQTTSVTTVKNKLNTFPLSQAYNQLLFVCLSGFLVHFLYCTLLYMLLVVLMFTCSKICYISLSNITESDGKDKIDYKKVKLVHIRCVSIEMYQF